MKLLISIIFIATALGGAFRWATAAETPQQCRSDQGGYCVRVAAIAQAQTGVPGLEFLQISPGVTPGELISVIYRWGIGLVGLAALAMFIWGGIEYMTALDKPPTGAQKRMKNALIGLLLALGSYLILYTINPQLVTTLDLGLTPLHLQATPAATQSVPVSHVACVSGECKSVPGPGENNCSACGGIQQGAANAASGQTYCFIPSTNSCRLYSLTLCKQAKGVDTGVNPTSCPPKKEFVPANQECPLNKKCGENQVCIVTGQDPRGRCYFKGEGGSGGTSEQLGL